MKQNDMEMIFTNEQLNRFGTQYGHTSIDLHALSVEKAYRFLKNVIALTREAYTYTLIHGYRHGTKIKDMIYQLQSDRIELLQVVDNNPGASVLVIKPVY